MSETLEQHVALMTREGSGFIGALNEEQKKIYVEMRSLVTDAECDFIKSPHETHEGIILKFLRARKFDLKLAHTFWKESIAFREEFDFKTLRTMMPIDVHGFPDDEYLKYYPGWQINHDKLGRPVWYEKTGMLQVPNLIRCVGHNTLLRAYVIGVEKYRTPLMLAGMAKNGGKYVESTTSIIDLEGMNSGLTAQDARHYLSDLSKLNSTCYPESMGKLFVINAPMIFTMVWGIVKAMLDERTISKIEVHGGPDSWKPRLLEFIDADQLPIMLGGKWAGDPCPCKPTSVDVNVRSGGEIKVDMPISKGKVGGWEWYLSSSDIYFGASFTTKDGKTMDILPVMYYDKASIKMIKEKYEAHDDGVLHLNWKNNGWTSRDLCYRTYIIGEQGGEKEIVKESDVVLM